MFEDSDIISVYSRADAIAEGVLVDVTHRAKSAGIRWPVAVTAATWEAVVLWKRKDAAWETTEGRLWDLVAILAAQLRGLKREGKEVEPGVKIPLQVRLASNKGGYKIEVHDLVWTVTGGDNGEPVITILLPEED